METTTSACGTAAAASGAQAAARPNASAQASAPCARSSERARTVVRVKPRSASAANTGRAVPPAPTTTADSPVAPHSARRPSAPSTSVQSASQPDSVRTRVLAEPTVTARSVRSSANSSAANFPGIVTETPTHSGPKPPTRPGSASASHSIRS